MHSPQSERIGRFAARTTPRPDHLSPESRTVFRRNILDSWVARCRASGVYRSMSAEQRSPQCVCPSSVATSRYQRMEGLGNHHVSRKFSTNNSPANLGQPRAQLGKTQLSIRKKSPRSCPHLSAAVLMRIRRRLIGRYSVRPKGQPRLVTKVRIRYAVPFPRASTRRQRRAALLGHSQHRHHPCKT